MKKQKNNIFPIAEIYDSLSMLDIHCAWFNISYPKYKNKIVFDGDKRGNGNGPYLEITFYKKYARPSMGTHLKPYEKKNIYPYNEFKDVDDFSDCLAKFINEYFDSIKLVRV